MSQRRKKKMRLFEKSLSNIVIFVLIIIAIGVIGSGIIIDNKRNAAVQTLVKELNEKENKELQRISKLNFYEKLKEKRDISVLIIGDSIAQSDGRSTDDGAWSKILQKWLSDKYGVDSSIKLLTAGGSTVTRGWVEYNRNNLRDDYDLVFICFGQNDQGKIDILDFQNFYESLIRKIKTQRPDTEIIPIIESSIRVDNDYTKSIKDLSSYYSLNFADMRIAFKNSLINYNKLIADGPHPNDTGYKYYAQSIKNIIDTNSARNKKISYNNKKSLYVNTDKLNTFKFPNTTNEIKGFKNIDNVFVSNNVGDSLTFKTAGKYAILSHSNSKQGGKFKLYLDNKFIKEINTNSYSTNWTYTISNQLNGEHTIKIVTSYLPNGGNVKIIGIATE